MQEPSHDMRRRLAEWGVTPAGPPQVTPSSELLPGMRDGRAVMLKIALVDEEVRGAGALAWWSGRGAAVVLEREGGATLMERATGVRDLTLMAVCGRDAAATEILVQTALILHERRPPVPVPLAPLRDWFRDLLGTRSPDPVLHTAAELAETLLATTSPADEVALHGDIHHGNVLDFGDHWAAIDPKGLIGHRAFDYANILCNPTVGTALPNLGARLRSISRQAQLAPDVLAEWTIAWCGLTLTWGRDDPAPSAHARAARAVAERLLADRIGRPPARRADAE
jgi:streptomycin 6-kinase